MKPRRFFPAVGSRVPAGLVAALPPASLPMNSAHRQEP